MKHHYPSPRIFSCLARPRKLIVVIRNQRKPNPALKTLIQNSQVLKTNWESENFRPTDYWSSYINTTLCQFLFSTSIVYNPDYFFITYFGAHCNLTLSTTYHTHNLDGWFERKTWTAMVIFQKGFEKYLPIYHQSPVFSRQGLNIRTLHTPFKIPLHSVQFALYNVPCSL